MSKLKENEVYSVWERCGYEDNHLHGLFKSWNGAKAKFDEIALHYFDDIGLPERADISGGEELYFSWGYDSVALNIETINP